VYVTIDMSGSPRIPLVGVVSDMRADELERFGKRK
jgi:hypothetical protein